MQLKLSGSIVILLSVVGCSVFNKSASQSYQEYKSMSLKPLYTTEQACKILPQSVKDVQSLANNAVRAAREQLDELIAIAPDHRNFSNTVQAYDRIVGAFSSTKAIFEMTSLVYPDKELRTSIQENFVTLKNKWVELFEDPRLYQAFKVLEERPSFFEQLTEQENYYFNESMSNFVKQGMSLSSEDRVEVQRLKKEINALTVAFSTNVASDKSGIEVTDEELAGINPHVLKNLKKTSDGKRFVGCDYPTYNEVMRCCTVTKTRRDLRKAFNNRAYPANDAVLKKIIKLRHLLATKLGFDNYADLEVDKLMSKKTSHVKAFLDVLATKAKPKIEEEFSLLTSDLPDGIALNPDGTVHPGDLAFIVNSYKKKHFNIDESKISEYFPVDKALAGMLGVYEEFFGLKFEEVAPSFVWHPSVRVIKVTRAQTSQILGHLFLDLYPRADKYTHACCGAMIPTYIVKDADDKDLQMPAVVMVVANFPQAKGDKPALLTFADVTTFFHEFGHAMHAFLTNSSFMTGGIDAVKIDFVETPSQMFEEWIYQPDILHRISSHYQTGESLPLDLVKKKIELKKFASGSFVLGQVNYAQLALQIHMGSDVDLEKLVGELDREYSPFVASEEKNHMYASFEHLVMSGYGAGYYGYLWSRVFAQDLFNHILKLGLNDPAVGQRFADTVFGPGGIKDPELILEDFLGRPASQDAFFRNYGLSKQQTN